VEEEAVEIWRKIPTLGREGERKVGGNSIRQRQTADGPGKGERGDMERGKRGKENIKKRRNTYVAEVCKRRD
jgi:hypothetical protein